MPKESRNKKKSGKSFKNKAKAPSTADNEPVTLEFIEGSPAPNLPSWMRFISQKLQIDFGVHGNFIETNKLYKGEIVDEAALIAEEPISSDSESDEDDTPDTRKARRKRNYAKKIRRSIRTERFRLSVKQEADTKTKAIEYLPMMFHFILSTISVLSYSKVKSSEKWKNINATKNPLELVHLIDAVHSCGCANDRKKIVTAIKNTLDNIRQRPNESLDSYKLNFYDILERYDAAKITRPEEDELIRKFVNGLDVRRYKAALKAIEIKEAEEEVKYETVETIYDALSLRVPDGRDVGFVEPELNTVFAAMQSNTGGGKGGGSKGGGGKGGGTNNKSANFKPKGAGTAGQTSVPSTPCPLCPDHIADADKMHYRDQCPHFKKLKADQDKLRPSGSKLPKKVSIAKDVNVTIGEDSMFHMNCSVTSSAVNAFRSEKLEDDHFLFDCAANTCICFNPLLLDAIQDLDVPRKLNGVAGGLTVTKMGYLRNIGWVLFDTRAKVNVISKSKTVLASHLDHDYIKSRDVYIVDNLTTKAHMVFKPLAGMYARRFPVSSHASMPPPSLGDDMYAVRAQQAEDDEAAEDSDSESSSSSSDSESSSSDSESSTSSSNSDTSSSGSDSSDPGDELPPHLALQVTSEQLQERHSKRELDKLEQVSELSRRFAYPSTADLVKLVRRGIEGCDITVEDVYRAARTLGPDPDAVKGKTKRRKTALIKPEYLSKSVPTDQTLYSDIMFVLKVAFLITVTVPLNLVLATHLPKGKSTASLKAAFQHQISMLAAQGFTAKQVIFDGEGAIASITTELESMGLQVEQLPKGAHVGVVEHKQEVIKERSRSIISGLWFIFSRALVVVLVYFVVSRLNMHPCNTMEGSPIPREDFTGRKINSKDVALPFGRLVLIHEHREITNTMAPRAQEAIAVLPLGNLSGAVKFFTIGTHKFVTRTHWTEVKVIPDWVRDNLNKLAIPTPDLPAPPDITFEHEVDGVQVPIADAPIVPEPEIPQPRAHEVTLLENPTDIQDATLLNPDPDSLPSPMLSDGGVTALTPLGSPLPTSPLRTTVDPRSQDPSPTTSGVPPRRYPARDNRTTYKDISVPALVHNISVKKALNQYGKSALKSIVSEIQQLVDKTAFTPQHLNSLTKNQLKKIISSHMFLKEKFTSTGEFEKLKSRLVAGGHMQDKADYDDVSSPTVSTSAAFMIAAIAAGEGRSVATVDIAGAYLNASMSGEEVLMRLDKTMSDILIKIRPDYAQYLTRNGTMIVRLDKALYGCVESAKLWYDDLSSTLLDMGYKKNPSDLCVFNRTTDGVQCTICLHVDDLKITSVNEDLIEDTIAQLTAKYKTVTVHRGLIHSYLGMTFDYSTLGKVKITMEKFVADLLKDCEVTGTAATPATVHLFEIDENSPLLPPDRAKLFHSRVATVLYLAKRNRPDTLTTVAFLTTRVSAPTEEDWNKLTRLLKYINGTSNFGIVLEADKAICVLVWVDASYGVHADGKSHAGVCISLGRGAVYVRSGKQKLVSKSSTEAELIGLSDSLTQGIWTRDFLIFQGYTMAPATVYQDNMSTIALAEKGRSTSDRTRHISIRYFFVKDRIDSGEVRIEYMPTANMLADVLTKPLQGELFRAMRKQLLNWE